MKTDPLVIVHAGSFFGSDAFNLEPEEADLRREYFYETLSTWEGPMVRTVTEIDQDVEKSDWVHRSLADILITTDSVGDIDEELHDMSFAWDARDAAKNLELNKGETVWVTGAWYGPTGCVNETARALAALGYKPKIHDSSLPELFWGHKGFNAYVGRMATRTWKPRPRGMRINWKRTDLRTPRT